MKKLLFTLLTVSSLVTAYAQPHSLLVYVDGTLGMNKTSIAGTDSSTTQWHVLPGIGYQFNKHWTLGVQGGFGGTSAKHFGGSEVDNLYEWNAGLFGRYTKSIGNVFFFYMQLDASYINGQNNADLNGENVTLYNYNGFGATFTPAFGVHVTKCISMNFGFGGVGYRTTTTDESPAVKNDQLLVTFGQQFNLGLSANLHQGHHGGHHHRMDPGADMHHIDASDDSDDDAPAPKEHKKHHKHKKDDIDD